MSPLTMPIRVPADVLESLGELTGNFWSDSLALEPIICDAIRAYMKSAPAAPAASAVQQQPAAPSEAGYQWKEVFLPEGTRLRACFGRQPYFAVVEGAEIKYGDNYSDKYDDKYGDKYGDKYAVSPSRFANLYGSGNRNAWKAIWLRLPGSEDWLLADVCRSARKTAIARLFGGDAPPERQRSRTAAHPRLTELTEQTEQIEQTEIPPSSAPAMAHGNDDRRKNDARTAQERRRTRRPPPAPCEEAHSRKSVNNLIERRCTTRLQTRRWPGP